MWALKAKHEQKKLKDEQKKKEAVWHEYPWILFVDLQT